MRRLIQEILRPSDRRLGRHIHHDPRSLAYVLPDGTAQSVTWSRAVPIFDQGNLGSCTGNAAAGALATEPFWDTLSATLTPDEDLAVSIYNQAEILDGGAGLPSEDSGSSGLSVAKVCQSRKYISGYVHALTTDAAHTALQAGPFITGTDWMTGMDSPNSDGIVTATGTVRGGHEYLCREYDATRDLWWFDNSWGTSFGKEGRFAYDTNTFEVLLSRQGDVTSFVPISQPAPVPTPPVVLDPADHDLAAAIPFGWTRQRHSGANKKVATALEAWLIAKGIGS